MSAAEERSLRALVAEQAALRRVAVLVARGAPQQEVFDAVSREVGELMRAGTAGLLRLEEHDQILLISGYSPPDLPRRAGGSSATCTTARSSGSHLPVTLEAPAERLPPAVEATTYYVVAEALTNIAKYAQASSATVIVRVGEALHVEIADDGTGGAVMDGDDGLRGLADRVEALAGTFRLHSPAGARTTIPLSART